MTFWSSFGTITYTKDQYCFNESIFQWQIKLISYRSEFWHLRRKSAVVFLKWLFFQNSLAISWVELERIFFLKFICLVRMYELYNISVFRQNNYIQLRSMGHICKFKKLFWPVQNSFFPKPYVLRKLPWFLECHQELQKR